MRAKRDEIPPAELVEPELTAEVVPYRLPLREPYRWAKGLNRLREGLLVIFTAANCRGIGEVAFGPHEKRDLAGDKRQLEACLGHYKVEQLLSESAALHPRMRAAVSSAWYSLRAQIAGCAMSEFVTGAQLEECVPVNGLIVAESLEDIEQQALEMGRAGCRAIKLKCGCDSVAQDIERARAIRRVFDGSLRLDANESWDISEMVLHADTFAELSLQYIEQPFPITDIAAAKDTVAALSVPIAIDESATSAAVIDELLEKLAVQYVILKPARLGGPDRVWEAIQKIALRGARGIVTNSLETSVGLTCAFECARMLGVIGPIPCCGLDTARFFDTFPTTLPKSDNFSMQYQGGGGLGVMLDDVILNSLRKDWGN